MMLLAGNLVGMGVILAYVWGMTVEQGIWTTFIVVWLYTVSGGLFSVAYTDVVQGIMGWSGCVRFCILHDRKLRSMCSSTIYWIRGLHLPRFTR